MPPPTKIDPRIRARRIEVQRDQGRRRLRRLAWLAGFAGVVAGLLGLTRTALLDVDHVEVVGAARSGEAAVQAASGVSLGDRLAGVPLGRVARRVSALPWVATARVTRGWPNAVRIEVVERQPLAAAPVRGTGGKRGGWVLLDQVGRQLAPVAEPPPGLARLEVRPVRLAPGQGTAAAFRAMLTVALSVPPSLRPRILVLRPARPGEVGATVRLRNGETSAVELGPPDQLDRKWLALASVIEQVDPRGLGRIDLRVPSAPALRRR